MAKLLGHRECPVCAWHSARCIETAKGRPMLYCDRCESQVFARGERSAGLLGQGIRPLDGPPDPGAPAAPGPKPDRPRRPGLLESL